MNTEHAQHMPRAAHQGAAADWRVYLVNPKTLRPIVKPTLAADRHHLIDAGQGQLWPGARIGIVDRDLDSTLTAAGACQ